ncbi:MAG: hypothetical protein U5L11_01365 [Arhodomonas sp.]|nr:hypothetical protein [Arhodomonas sp.]
MAALRARGGTLAGAGRQAVGGVGAAARDGFLIAFLNPKIAVFFVALFSQFVRPGWGSGRPRSSGSRRR